jgi:hypothetical protein
MATLNNLYIKKETLQTMLDTLERKGEKGISLTVAVNDDAANYGQNVSSFVSQSKEDREAGKKKYYVGNGKTFWSNKGDFIPAREQAAPAGNNYPNTNYDERDDDLPF